MARPKATPEQREQTRRVIQEAARTIYRAKGINGISARAVAKEAGVSVGAIYAHFDDLTELMQSLWTERVEKQNEVFKQIATQNPDPLLRISALMSAYLEFGLSNKQLYRNAFLFVRPEAHEKPDLQPVKSIVFAELFTAAIEEGQAAGEICSGPPEVLMQILWSGLHGVIALPINFDRLDFTPTSDIAEVTVETLIQSIGKV